MSGGVAAVNVTRDDRFARGGANAVTQGAIANRTAARSSERNSSGDAGFRQTANEESACPARARPVPFAVSLVPTHATPIRIVYKEG